MIRTTLKAAKTITGSFLQRSRLRIDADLKQTALIYQCRQIHHPTEKNVIVSSCPDVFIPNFTLPEFVWQNMHRWADKAALVCGITGKEYTYSTTYKMTVNFGACLRLKLKLVEGDCVAVMLPNSPEFLMASLGAIHAGCIVTTVNPIYTPDEIKNQLKNAKAKIVVTTFECYQRVKTAVDKLGIPIILTDCSGNPIPEGAINFTEFAEDYNVDTDCLNSVQRTIDDTAFLPYSSGTTGLPKGVELTQRNIIANSIQMMAPRNRFFFPADGNHQDTTICVLPFFHIYGLVITLISKLAYGVKLVTLPKFNPATFLNAQEKYKASNLFLAPPLILFLTTLKDVKQAHFDPLNVVVSGAAPMADSDIHRFLERAQKDIDVIQGFGMTETSPGALIQEIGSKNYASVGGPVPNTHAKIVDLSDDNNTLGPNQTGELWVRGPQIMKGYYENPAANEDIFRPGEWMRTGDIAHYDENEEFYITDRLKELIKVKGYQVAPAELEGVLRSHPDLIDAGVIGIPHDTFGEVPKAFVVRKEGCSPTADDIMKFVASKVAKYKNIGEVAFIDAVPKSAAGKILRRELKSKFN